MARSANRNGEYCAVYKNFGGIDLTGKKSGSGRLGFAYTENMYRDYEGDFPNAIESVPGFRKIVSLGAFVNSIFIQKCSKDGEYIVVHAGDSLYRFNVADRDSISSLSPIATLKNGKSHAFGKGGTLFVSDGTNLLAITKNGEVENVRVEDSPHVYVPTTFKNAKPFEQRNLLTKKFKESYVIADRDKHLRSTPGLKYELCDDEETCSVVGISDTSAEAIYIPKYAKLGDKYYKITGIGDNAFSGNGSIRNVHIAEGLTSIGANAFYGCSRLYTVECPSSIEVIGDSAFSDCPVLTDVFIGKSIRVFGNLTFKGSFYLKSIKFEGDEESLAAVENISSLEDIEILSSSPRPDVHYATPIFTPFAEISEAYLSCAPIEFTAEKRSDGTLSELYFTCASDSAPEGGEILIVGTFEVGKYTVSDEGVDFILRAGTDENIIAQCGCSALFDGRIFVAGNPNYPSTVFYSLDARGRAKDLLYFGSLAYFDDGMSTYETVSLTPTADALVLFKARDDGCGGIFYHEAKAAGDFLERTYPVSHIHTGISVMGGSVSNLDEIFFLSDVGVCTLKKSSTGNRFVTCRSEKINPLLLGRKNIGSANMTTWLGYTVIQIGSEIFLADARQAFCESGEEYDWYYLKDIGIYKGVKATGNYSAYAPSGVLINENQDAKASGAIYSVTDPTYGEMYYVSPNDSSGKKYGIYLTGETAGGTFSPASCIFSDGRLLFFGTEGGEVMMFNNDKRGVAPESVSSLEGFDAEEYERSMGNRLHPEFYDFSKRRATYKVVTKPDDGGIPYLKKSSVVSSLSLSVGQIGGTETLCELITDEGSLTSQASGFATAALSFDDLNFAAVCFEVSDESSICVLGGPKSWQSKQISISSSQFRSPLCVSQISYRYKIKSRLTRK